MLLKYEGVCEQEVPIPSPVRRGIKGTVRTNLNEIKR